MRANDLVAKDAQDKARLTKKVELIGSPVLYLADDDMEASRKI